MSDLRHVEHSVKSKVFRWHSWQGEQQRGVKPWLSYTTFTIPPQCYTLITLIYFTKRTSCSPWTLGPGPCWAHSFVGPCWGHLNKYSKRNHHGCSCSIKMYNFWLTNTCVFHVRGHASKNNAGSQPLPSHVLVLMTTREIVLLRTTRKIV